MKNMKNLFCGPEGDRSIPPPPVKKSPANPTEWFAGESEEIPNIAQFSALRAGNGAVLGISELERATRLELATSTLARWRSTR